MRASLITEGLTTLSSGTPVSAAHLDMEIGELSPARQSRKRRALALPMLLAAITVLLINAIATAATNFDVTSSGATAYVIQGVSNPALTLTRGQTYTFRINTTPHPFWIVTTRGAGDTSSNEFAEGVTGNGASPGTVTFAVPTSAPSTLFYQCSFHDPMGGTLNIVDAPVSAAIPTLNQFMLGMLGVLLAVVAVIARSRTR